jgi:hypothetical protein
VLKDGNGVAFRAPVYTAGGNRGAINVDYSGATAQGSVNYSF